MKTSKAVLASIIVIAILLAIIGEFQIIASTYTDIFRTTQTSYTSFWEEYPVALVTLLVVTLASIVLVMRKESFLVQLCSGVIVIGLMLLIIYGTRMLSDMWT